MSAKTAVTWRLHWAGGICFQVADTHGRQIGAGHLEELSACLCGPLHKAFLEYPFTIWLLASCRVSDPELKVEAPYLVTQGSEITCCPKDCPRYSVDISLDSVCNRIWGHKPREWQSLGTISEAGYHRCPSKSQFTNSLKRSCWSQW